MRYGGHYFVLLVSGAAMMSEPSTAATGDPALIANAVSAAPRAIGAHATVVRIGEKGEMTVLRKGANGWTCMPDDPGTPGEDPMCVDKNGMAWMHALMAHKAPDADKPGMAYMLKGGSDASNLDPNLEKPAAGDKWVTTGPHVMILSAQAAKASGYPSGEKAPDTSRPYVMYGGTPYAHIMLPVR
jgi:hypothetical protein